MIWANQQILGFQRKTTGRCAIKTFTGSIVLIHKPKKLGNSWIVTSIFTMPIISSHVEVVVIYPPASISGNILGLRLLDGYWRVKQWGNHWFGDPDVEKQPAHMGTFQFDGKVRKCRDLLCILVVLAGYSFSLWIVLDINSLSPKFPTLHCGSP